MAKYLYSLGFDRTCKIINDREYWIFDKSSTLKEALDFYFYMRKETENKLLCSKIKGDAEWQKDFLQKKN